MILKTLRSEFTHTLEHFRLVE